MSKGNFYLQILLKHCIWNVVMFLGSSRNVSGPSQVRAPLRLPPQYAAWNRTLRAKIDARMTAHCHYFAPFLATLMIHNAIAMLIVKSFRTVAKIMPTYAAQPRLQASVLPLRLAPQAQNLQHKALVQGPVPPPKVPNCLHPALSSH